MKRTFILVNPPFFLHCTNQLVLLIKSVIGRSQKGEMRRRVTVSNWLFKNLCDERVVMLILLTVSMVNYCF